MSGWLSVPNRIAWGGESSERNFKTGKGGMCSWLPGLKIKQHVLLTLKKSLYGQSLHNCNRSTSMGGGVRSSKQCCCSFMPFVGKLIFFMSKIHVHGYYYPTHVLKSTADIANWAIPYIVFLKKKESYMCVLECQVIYPVYLSWKKGSQDWVANHWTEVNRCWCCHYKHLFFGEPSGSFIGNFWSIIVLGIKHFH